MGLSNWGEWRQPYNPPTHVPYPEPIFGVKAWGANSTCDDVHHGPIPAGSNNCCMSCHTTGHDGHPDLSVTPKDEQDLKVWVPDTEDGRDRWSDDPSPESQMTRKQRRQAHAKFDRPMDPFKLAKLVDSGTAKPVACR